MRQELVEHINAAFSGIWVQTHQPDEAEREIGQLAREHNWELAVWDIARGVRTPGVQGTGGALGLQQGTRFFID